MVETGKTPDPFRRYLPVLAFFIPMLVYILTLCPSVYWRDSAEFVEVAFALGIPHPSGFPTYMPLANLLTFLPMGPIAFKINLFSALMGATTSLILFYLIIEIIVVSGGERDARTHFIAFTSAIAFAFSFSFWESGVTAEVYSALGAASAGILFFAIRWKEMRDRRYLMAGGFLLGLASGIHSTVALFLPALLFFVIINLRGKEKAGDIKDLVMATFFFFLGFSVFIYLPIRSAANPKMDWGDPETLKQFLIHITDRKDSEYHFIVSRGSFWSNLVIFLKITIKELTPLWPISAIIGLIVMVRRNLKTAIFLLLFFLGHVSFFIWYWDSGTIYVASFIVVMALGGVGLHFLLRLSEKIEIPNLRPGRVGAVLLLAFVAYSLLMDYRTLDKSSYYQAETLSLSDYTRFAPDSMVLTSLYWPFFYYFQDVMKLREDITIIPLSDIFEPTYFNRVTGKRFPQIEVPEFSYNEDNFVDFLRELIYLNRSEREIYIGPDIRVIEKYSPYIVPELFFFRFVDDRELMEAKGEFYSEYFKRLGLFLYRELSSHQGEFFVDHYYHDYYYLSLKAIASYLSFHGLLSEEKSVIMLSEPILGRDVVGIDLDLPYKLSLLHKFTEAEDILRLAVKYYPDEPFVHINLGHNLLFQGRFDEAISEFDMALKLGGANAEGYYGIGEVLYFQGRYEEALKALEEARDNITENTSDADIEDIDALFEEVKTKLAHDDSVDR